MYTRSSLELPYKLEGDSPKPLKVETTVGSGRRSRNRNRKSKHL